MCLGTVATSTKPVREPPPLFLTTNVSEPLAANSTIYRVNVTAAWGELSWNAPCPSWGLQRPCWPEKNCFPVCVELSSSPGTWTTFSASRRREEHVLFAFWPSPLLGMVCGSSSLPPAGESKRLGSHWGCAPHPLAARPSRWGLAGRAGRAYWQLSSPKPPRAPSPSRPTPSVFLLPNGAFAVFQRGGSRRCPPPPSGLRPQ